MGLQDAGRSRHEVRVVLLAVAVGWLAAGSASAQGLGPLVEAFWAAGSVDEIDEARAEEAIQRAQERIAAAGDDVNLERALASLRRGQIRLQITRLRRRNRPMASGSAPG